ncbi:MAG: hypothetical protein D6714_13750 [Bacteroidetes bacterium]|nr:MAG: hypothetical protein D6714_13750 [Bacteroidota bacterium]
MVWSGQFGEVFCFDEKKFPRNKSPKKADTGEFNRVPTRKIRIFSFAPKKGQNSPPDGLFRASDKP